MTRLLEGFAAAIVVVGVMLLWGYALTKFADKLK